MCLLCRTALLACQPIVQKRYRALNQEFLSLSLGMMVSHASNADFHYLIFSRWTSFAPNTAKYNLTSFPSTDGSTRGFSQNFKAINHNQAPYSSIGGCGWAVRAYEVLCLSKSKAGVRFAPGTGLMGAMQDLIRLMKTFIIVK